MRVEIEKSIVYISQNFRQKLPTEQLAKNSGLSPFHFHRLFQSETGFTPQKYVEKLRLEHAAHMMALNPEITKIQLAFESGFSSPAVFSRAFKSYFGLSPSKYHKQSPNPTLEAEKLEKSQAFSISHDLTIKYLSSFFISAQLLNLESSRIEASVSNTYFSKDLISLYGVFLDAPIHFTPADCKYLLGHQVAKAEDSNYQIEAGYYVQLLVQGDFELLIDRVIELHKYLTQNNYRIRNPVAFEKIDLPNTQRIFSYAEAKRELFIPISRI